MIFQHIQCSIQDHKNAHDVIHLEHFLLKGEDVVLKIMENKAAKEGICSRGIPEMCIKGKQS
jgi:hypothetical protein